MTSIISFNSIQEDFPVTAHSNFLASCAVAPMPARVAAASKAYYDQRMLGERSDLDSIFRKGRSEAAKLIDARQEEIAFVKGTTEGLNTVASMINYQSGQNIVLSDMEFTSNVYPWMKAARENGIELRVVKGRNDGIWPSDFEKLIDNKTAVVAISNIQMANGFRCDLGKITKLAHEKGALVCVDAIQSLGALEVNSKDPPVDFMVAGAHKWLLGPSGIGLLYVRRDIIDRFEPAFIGPWQEDLVYEAPIDFTFRQYKLSNSARRFELGGHPNVPGVMGFVESLSYINEIGITNIEAKNRKLFQLAVEGCLQEKLSIPDWARPETDYRSSFIGYKSKIATNSVVEKAKKAGVIVAPNRTIIGDRIRIAPHLFNTEENVLQAVEVLSQLERELI
jgi:cysteine desulfurase / selenocysteine lyase